MGGGAKPGAGLSQASMRLPMSEIAAEQFNSLAKTAHQANNFRDAISLYDRVLAYRREKLGGTHPDVAATLHNIGRVFIDTRQPEQAEAALAEACMIYEKHHGKDNIKYADSQAILAVAYRDMGNYVEAEKHFKESLRTFRREVYDSVNNSWIPADKKVPDQPNLDPLATVAHILNDTAVLFINEHQLERAISFIEDSLEIRRFLYTGNAKFKPMIAQSLTKYSEIKRALGDINAAELAINECLDICYDTVGRSSPATAAAMSSKGNVFAVKQQFREALKCYEEAATTYAGAFGKESPLVASEFLHIGRMQEMLDDTTAAVASFNKALDFTRKTLGTEHVQIAEANAFLASVHMKRSENDHAIPLLRDAVRIRTKINPNDPALAFVYHKLGDALAAKQDAEAEAHFLQAIEIHRSYNTDTQMLLMTDCLDDLGLHYTQFRHYEKAEEVLMEALQTRLRIQGDVSPTVAYSYSNIALLRLAQENFEEGAKSAENALSVYGKIDKGDVHLAMADAHCTLGQCYAGMKDLLKAKKALHTAIEMRRVRGEVAIIAVAEGLNELARVNIQLGDTGEASDQVDEAANIAARYPVATVVLRNEIDKTKRMFPSISTPPPGSPMPE